MHSFKEDISNVELPDKFTYPFNYTPHPLSIKASIQLQEDLKQFEGQHEFGLNDKEGHGKMFGILVVKNKANEIGFLKAFSGKLMDKNNWPGFVPPIYDMLSEEGFYKKGELDIMDTTAQIIDLENSDRLLLLEKKLAEIIRNSENELNELQGIQSNSKQERKLQRQTAISTLEGSELEHRLKEMDHESAAAHFKMKDLKSDWKLKIQEAKYEIDQIHKEINRLKDLRKNKSIALQKKLFASYNFINANGEYKNTNEIFTNWNIDVPPSGSGECAAPKLLQYAYLNQLQPIALAEFWHGKSPSSEIRSHGRYYASCRSKCLPILTHMMKGLKVEENSMLIRISNNKILEIIYEDDCLIIVNKPHDFLSVPGGEIKESVYSRVKEMYPLSSGPLIVHRLDMSTSGLMIIALTKNAHYHIQKQFELKTIQKKYKAILDGIIPENEGEISLPLRVDLDDRPRQLVDFIHGKLAKTKWEVVSRTHNQTTVYFYPITGRTHQLRVHASHPSGLNTPILGDDLYGTRSERLYLHAEEIRFIHPITNKELCFVAKCPF